MMIGASIQCTTGIYPAELQAIARSLAMMPASFDIHIHTDSRSSIDAISSSESNERRRLRRSSRPLLSLIHHQLGIRQRAGGNTTLSHVRAHTSSADRHSVGNRIADFHANLARDTSGRGFPLSLVELPIRECEPFMSATDEDGRAMIDDCRRSSMSVVREAELHKWTVTHAADQGRLASSAMIQSCREVMQHGSSTQQATLVHVATNTIHYHWHAIAGAPRRLAKLVQLQCSAHCLTSLTVAHLAACPHHRAYRQALRDAIVGLLDRHELTHDWLRVNSRLDLHRLMSTMIPSASPIPAASDASCLRRTRLMVGAFTSAESDAAMLRIGLDDDVDSRTVMVEMRLICLDHIATLYNKLKQ